MGGEPPQSNDTAPPRPSLPPGNSVVSARDQLLAFSLIFTSLFLTHAPLLRLPYFWDEAGYFVPAARDILLTGSLIPHTTLSNAHPPLVMLWLAFWWKFSGFTPAVTRIAMLLVAAFGLLGVWRLARHVANDAVAAATVICTAFYPVFFTPEFDGTSRHDGGRPNDLGTGDVCGEAPGGDALVSCTLAAGEGNGHHNSYGANGMGSCCARSCKAFRLKVKRCAFSGEAGPELCRCYCVWCLLCCG